MVADGLRSVVEELELERNQLQEQILNLEERCQDLEDRLQLQARIEVLQNETEKLQVQLASVRGQQSRDAEKHQLVVSSLNEQLRGLSDTQECLESSLMEKETTLARTCEKLELISSLRESLGQQELHYKALSEKLRHTEHVLENTSTRCNNSEKQSCELKAENVDLSQKLSVLKEKTLKQEATLEALQADLDQANEELDKINSTHLEERAQLIHDLQSREREIDSLKDFLLEKEKEVAALTGHLAEYAEQVAALKQEIRLKGESLVWVENALSNAEREAQILRDSQSSDQQDLNRKITELVVKVKDGEAECVIVRKKAESKAAEAERLIKQVRDHKKTIQALREEIQKQDSSHSALQLTCNLQEDVQRLTQEKQALQVEAAQRGKNICDVTAELESLKTNMSTLEMQHSHNLGVIDGLMKDKEELNVQTSELNKVLEQNSTLSVKIADLTKDHQRIQDYVQHQIRSISELTAEKSVLEQRNRGLDLQISDSQKTIGGLLEEKEKLIVAAGEMRRVLQEMEQVNSAGLLEKTNQCAHLSDTLRQREEQLQDLQNQVQGLKTEWTRLQEVLCDKEQTVSEQKSQLESQQHRLVQLQDAVSVLQEQRSVLESALLEKDAALQQKVKEVDGYQGGARLQKDLMSQLQEELETLRQQSAEAGKRKEEKEQAFKRVTDESQTQKEELRKRNESVKLLSSQLGVMNDNAAEMEARIAHLQVSVEKFCAEKKQLVQEEDRRKSEVLNFKDDIEALKEQNGRLKSELQNTATQISKAREQVANLEATVAARDEELQKAHSEKEAVSLTVWGRDQVLNQRQGLIEQLNSKISEQDHWLKQRSEDSVSFQTRASELQASVCDLQDQVDRLTAESSELRSTLEKKELARLECQTHTASTVENLNSQLQAKEAECQSLKEEISHLEESVAKLRDTIQVQVSQTQNIQKSLEEKEAALCGQSETLQEVQRRADKASLFKTQFSESAELVSRLQSRVEQLSAESEDLRRSAGETQGAFNNLQEKYASNLEELRDARTQLSQRSDEVSDLRTSLEALSGKHHAAVEALRRQLSATHQELEKVERLNSTLSKEKEEALTSHRADASQLHAALRADVARLQESAEKLTAEKEELEKRCGQLQASQREALRVVEQTASEKQKLHAKVSSKDEDISQLEEQAKKMEQILQDSEKEWLLVLEREKQDKKLLAEQLRSVENVVKSKDVKVVALKRDLDSLQEKLAEASAAIQLGSDQLSVKESQSHHAIAERLRDFEERLRCSQKEVETSNSEKLELLRKTEDLQTELAKVGKEKDAMKKKLQAALVVRKDLMRRIGEYENQKEESLSSRAEVSQLREELQEVTSEVRRFEESVPQLETKLTEKESEFFEHKAESQRLVEQLQSEKETLRSTLKEKEASLIDLSQVVREKDSVIQQLRSSSAGKEEALQRDKQNLTQQVEELHAKITRRDEMQEKSLSRASADDFEKELAQLKSEKATLQKKAQEEIWKYRGTTSNVHCDQSKVSLLTRKLQAALVSRKEILKESAALREEVERLSALESSTSKLQQQNQNDRFKETTHKLSKEVEELQEENQKLKEKLRDRNHQMEAEISRVKESSEALRGKVCELRAENGRLADRIQQTTDSFEKKDVEPNIFANNLQLKLDEALNLNNSLTAQIKAQKTEFTAQLEVNNLLQKEKQNLCERIENILNDHELHLGKRDDAIRDLQDVVNKHSQETVDLNKKVRILEDDKSLLQEELENAREISDKVKKENKYLEAVILRNSKKIDELTESVAGLHSQNSQLSTQLATSEETNLRVCQEKEEEQLKLVRELEEKLKRVQRDSEGTKNVKKELQELLREKHQEINQLQQNCIRYQELIWDLESSLKSSQSDCKRLESHQAKLSALTSTPHGADASKRWDQLYQKTLQEKDNQLLQQGFTIKRFLEDTRLKDKEVNEVRVSKSRLERTLNEYSVAAAARQRQLFVMSTSNAELSETCELLGLQVQELRRQVEGSEQDKNTLARQVPHKDDTISDLQLRSHQVEKINADTEAELLLVKSQNCKIQADLDKQEGLCVQLRTLLQSKDAEISSLLVCKDGQMSGYLQQLQANHHKQVSVYEDRLTSLRYQKEQAGKEVRGLEAKVRSLQIRVDRSVQEKEQMTAKMESFKKSMASLQSERERLMSELRILQAKSQKVSLDHPKGKIQRLEKETDQKLSDAEERYNGELDVLEREVELMRSERETADQRVAELAADLLDTEQQLSEARSQGQDLKTRNESLCKSMAALQNDRDQLIEDFKVLRNRYDEELRETRAALNKVERSLWDATSDLAMYTKQRDILVHKSKALESQDAPTELNKLLEDLSKALSEKERDLKQATLENTTYSMQLAAFSRSMASLQNDRDRLMDQLLGAQRGAESRRGAAPQSVTAPSVEKSQGSRVSANQSQADGSKVNELQPSEHKEVGQETAALGSDAERKDSLTVQGPLHPQVAPGAPHERNNHPLLSPPLDSTQLRERLLDLERLLSEERSRRATAEEALRLCEGGSVWSGRSRDPQRDFSIEMEPEEDGEALSLDPSQPLITRKVKGGMVTARRWLRGRSLYFSRLLTSRARSRYLFLTYLLTIHVLVLMCLTGVL